jgi:CRP/FNR family transcriptional activator FtrB
LIREGAQADFLHVLIDGLAEIYTEQDGGEWGITLVNPVSTSILAAIVSDQPYLNSAGTLVESRVLLIPARRVREIFAQDVAFARQRTCVRLSRAGQETQRIHGEIER